MLKDNNCFNQTLVKTGWVREILNDSLSPACLDIDMLDSFIQLILENNNIDLKKNVTFQKSFRVGSIVVDFERNCVNYAINKNIFKQTTSIIDIFFNQGKISIEGKNNSILISIVDYAHDRMQTYKIAYDEKNKKISLEEKTIANELVNENQKALVSAHK